MRSLIMQAHNVIASLEGRKTQTRRIITPQPFADGEMNGDVMWRWHCGRLPAGYCHTNVAGMLNVALGVCPYGKVGDRLYVKETCWIDKKPTSLGLRAFFENRDVVFRDRARPMGKCPLPCTAETMDLPGSCQRRVNSRHMPQWASRLWIELTHVGIERVQEIVESDAKAEGVGLEQTDPTDTPTFDASGAYTYCPKRSHVAGFMSTWDTINNSRGRRWSDNPWVWVLEYKPVERK